MERKLSVVMVILFVSTVAVCSTVNGGNVWFAGGAGAAYNSNLDRYEVAEHTTVTVEVIAEFAVGGMTIGAVTVDNGGTFSNQGVFSLGSLHGNLANGLFVNRGELKDGSGGNNNIVLFQIVGGVNIIPGQDIPAPAGEALYSFEVQAGAAGTTIDVDDLRGPGSINPFGPYPLKTTFESPGSNSADDITGLRLYVVASQGQTITVSVDAGGDYRTIQEAIDASSDGDTIMVSDGVYTGDGNRNIDFKTKAVTLRSENGPQSCVIDCENSGRAFYFSSGEDSDSVVNGFTISNGHVAGTNRGGAIYCDDSGPGIINCIFTNNSADRGGAVYGNASRTVLTNCTLVGNTASLGGALFDEGIGGTTAVNCILWDNIGGQIFGNGSRVSYCDVQGDWPGYGNIDADPLFADADGGDYHLKSQAGRADESGQTWLYGDDVTSPCIDAGNPGCPLGDEPDDEANIRINMGAFGGTGQASRSPADWALLADLTNDGVVDFGDYSVFAHFWSEDEGCAPADLDLSELVDQADLAIFVDQWLAD